LPLLSACICAHVYVPVYLYTHVFVVCIYVPMYGMYDRYPDIYVDTKICT
jgi:hypothetical protein